MTVDATRDDQAAGAPAKRKTKPFTALVVGTDDWVVEQAAASVVAAGHPVLRCHEPGEPAFPCNALIAGRVCPLDAGFDVVVTIRARPAAEPTLAEFGVTCALRLHVPLVVAGMAADSPFEAYAAGVVERSGDIVTACKEAVDAKGTIDLSAG